MLIVVATDAEYALAKKRWQDCDIIKTGVGGLNVIATLSSVARTQEIINFGYAGSNTLPIGAEIEVGESRLYHPNVDYDEPKYNLSGNVACYTSNDFVLSTDIKTPVVFDMELAYILALGFKRIKSIKIVSDNLSLKEYEGQVDTNV